MEELRLKNLCCNEFLLIILLLVISILYCLKVLFGINIYLIYFIIMYFFV